jgi:MarR family transcriptional regulator, lower aerobic nicotinate degradation pathway regulator
MSVPASELTHHPPAPPQELLDNTAFLLAKLGTSIKSQALDEFEQAGFSMYHYSVLAVLGEGDSSAQASIAQCLGLDSSQLVGVLDALEGQGLVERRRDPNDRRRHSVSLTADGKRQLVRLRAIAKRIEASVLAPLDESSRKTLHESLERIASGYDWLAKRD